MGDKGQRLDNNGFFYAVQGSMLVFYFMTISRQKIVVLEYKYNVNYIIEHQLLATFILQN